MYKIVVFVLSGFVTVVLDLVWFDLLIQPWRSILCGVSMLICFVLFNILINAFVASKDPDVIAASKLGIPMRRYYKYKEYYDEYEKLADAYGVDSDITREYLFYTLSDLKHDRDFDRYIRYRLDAKRQAIFNFLAKQSLNKK